MGLGLVNDNWTLQLTCDAYSAAQTDALLLPKASESWVLATLGGYSTTQQTSHAIAAALTNHFTRAEATANLVAFLAQANTYTDDQLVGYSTAAEMNQAIADALVPYYTGRSSSEMQPSVRRSRPTTRRRKRTAPSLRWWPRLTSRPTGPLPRSRPPSQQHWCR